MKRVVIYVTVVVFLLFNWMALGFPETVKSAEDIMKEEGLITEEDYNVAKQYSRFLHAEQQPEPQQLPSLFGNKQQWELGAEISHITYKEPGLMEEKGMMYGIDGSYVYRNQFTEFPRGIDIWMLKAEGRFSYGKVDYTGSGTVDNIDDYMLEFRGLWGCDISVLKSSTLTPFIGIGYRYLNDGFDKATGGYEREQSYFYSPIGIETSSELKNGWSIGVILEYDIFWSGKNKSHFSDITPAYNNLEFNQDEGYGCRGSVKFQKKGEKFDFVIEPFIRYWNIKQSDQDILSIYGFPYAYYVEPNNNSTEIGCKLVLKF